MDKPDCVLLIILYCFLYDEGIWGGNDDTWQGHSLKYSLSVHVNFKQDDKLKSHILVSGSGGVGRILWKPFMSLDIFIKVSYGDQVGLELAILSVIPS